MPRHEGPRNRHGLLGDYDSFMPPRMDLRDAIRLAADRRAGKIPPEGRVSTEVLRIGELALVRYRLGSEELRTDARSLGGDGVVTPDLARHTSVFGLLDGSGQALAQVTVTEEDRGDFSVFEVLGGKEVAPGAMHAVLARLDVPPTWRSGSDTSIEDRFCLRWGDDGWTAVEPRSVVVVTMHRLCFLTRPTLEERIDVMVAADPAWRLDDPDPDRAYWAKDHYRTAVWPEFERLGPKGVRPGFSSWMTDGEPRMVRVMGTGLDAELAALGAPEPDEDAPGAGPTP